MKKTALIAFLWGFAEATFFFFIPDIYLTRVAISNIKKAGIACVIAAIAACLGGSLMYCWGNSHSASAYNFLQLIPGISTALIKQVIAMVHAAPAMALLLAPVQGMPYKIFAVSFGAIQYNFSLFLLLSFVARLGRFLLLVIFSVACVSWLRRFCAPKILYWIHGLAWVAIYISYFLTMHRLYA